MTNPYVPKRKLSSCSQWLQSWRKYTNDSFDNMAIYLTPLIHGRGGITKAALALLKGLFIAQPLHTANPKPLHTAGPKPLHAVALTY
jgi:hypothetical protein